MKRMAALALALWMMLAPWAMAEESAGTLRLDQLSLSHVTPAGTRRVDFWGISLFFALGTPNGMPTLQGTFDNGQGQLVDAVVQLVDSEIQFSMGGISGIYALDLNALSPEGGALIAQTVSGVMALTATHPELLLRSVTQEAEDGSRLFQLTLPAQSVAGATQGLLTMGEGMESADDLDLDALRARLEAGQEDVVISFRYSESAQTFTLSLAQGEEAVELSGLLAMGTEPMIFVENSPEEVKYDLLNLDAATLAQLRDELDMIGIKFAHFADGSGLDNIM